MHTHVWRRRTAVELSVSGPIEPADVAALCADARQLRAGAALTIDLHRATVADLVLVRLAAQLEAEGPLAWIGLSRHQSRLLRYHGFGLRPRQHAAEAQEL